MALKATIYKCDLTIADMDRHYYVDQSLTIARHPSETDERLLVRLLSFARFASLEPEFTKDLFDTDEPAIWSKDLTGALKLWIELGHPDESKVRKACNRVEQVAIVTYSHATPVWWKQNQSKFTQFKNLSVLHLPSSAVQELAAQMSRGMELQINVQDGDWSVSLGGDPVQVDWKALKD